MNSPDMPPKDDGSQRKQAQIPAEHLLRRRLDARALECHGEHLAQRKARAFAEAAHGHQVLLRVECQAVVHPTIEVDGEIGNPQQRVRQTHQVILPSTGAAPLRATTTLPADRQVTIEPGAVERATVDLDRQLTMALAHQLGLRLDAQGGRIRVSPDQAGNPPVRAARCRSRRPPRWRHRAPRRSVHRA